MKRSERRILTTHTGRLPNPPHTRELLAARANDPAKFDALVQGGVADVVRKQAALMRAAAQECAPLGIRVNTVNPAATETRMMRSIEEMRTSAAGGAVTVEQVKRRTASRIPLQRYGAPEEVARMMLFLASDESSFCTGGVYMVDGGMSAGPS